MSLVFAFSAFSKELDKAKSHIDQVLGFELYKQYLSDIKKVRDKYNQNLQSSEFEKSLAKIPMLNRRIKVKKYLDKSAFLKDNKLILGRTGIKLTLNSYLQDSFYYKGKKIKLSCHSREACLRSFSKNLKQRVSSFSLITSAHADFSNLTKDDYKVLIALVSFDRSFEDIDSTFNPLSSDKKRRVQKVLNLEKLSKKIQEEASKCNSWQDSYKEYGKEQSFTVPTSYSSMFEISKKLLELEDEKEYEDKLANKLGKAVHTHSSITVSSDIFGSFGRKLNSQWKETLRCEKLPSVISFLKDTSENKKGKYCADSTCRDIKLSAVSEKSKDYCKSMESLKSCLENFYKVAKADFNDASRLGTDENEKEAFEELFESDPSLRFEAGKVINE